MKNKSSQNLRRWSEVLKYSERVCVSVWVCVCVCVCVWVTALCPGAAVSCRCFRWTNRDKALSIRTDQHHGRSTWRGSVCRPEAVATATGGMTGEERGWEEEGRWQKPHTCTGWRTQTDIQFCRCKFEDHLVLHLLVVDKQQTHRSSATGEFSKLSLKFSCV